MTSNKPLLNIENLKVSIENKNILKGINLKVNRGEIHAIMGPNGSGKSTLAYSLMGHQKYNITDGKITYKDSDLTELSTDERAKAGIFLAFQYPTAIPGVSVLNFLRTSLRAIKSEEMNPREFRAALKEQFKHLSMSEEFASRYVNDGFSGGEKKRFEALQMALIQPDLAILDETDSGLDIDALRVVSENVNRLNTPDRSIIVITHYQRLLNYIKPDFVHVLVDGRIVRSGGKELALTLEDQGYDWLIKETQEVAEIV